MAMETLEIDLLRQLKKSKWGMIGGGIMVVWGLIMFALFVTGRKGEYYSVLLTNSIYFIFLGLFHMYSSTGKDIRNLLGKAFIKITPAELIFKTSVFSGEQVFHWSEIESVNQVATKLKIHLKTGKTETIQLKDVEYQMIQKIKEKMENSCRERNIGYGG